MTAFLVIIRYSYIYGSYLQCKNSGYDVGKGGNLLQKNFYIVYMQRHA